MKSSSRQNRIVLALELHSSRFGYVVIDESSFILDWGVRASRSARKAKQELSRKLRKLIENWKPRHLVVTGSVGVTKREIQSLTASVPVRVQVLDRAKLRDAFGVRRKHELAEAAAKQIPVLAHLLPPPREYMNSEHYRMPIFGALAAARAFISRRQPRVPQSRWGRREHSENAP